MAQANIIILLLVAAIVLITLAIFLHIKVLNILYFLFPVSKEFSKKSYIFPWKKKKWTKDYPPSSMYP
uniref:ATP synthase F0 subunit 8 n=1 Tax=Mammut americanum TaxID=39053 RepID=A0A7D5K1C1_MAMAE|nr:ATP synthase F0 subunit 8 [Mammut americanum]QLF99492.1 ATP synthase F0 subunit 8 [Mammut americanum]